MVKQMGKIFMPSALCPLPSALLSLYRVGA